MGWFVHPDGTVGGEYASRGTKFAYPAAFEMLADRVPSAAAIAAHQRGRLAAGRGVGAREMDAWNQFPLLNNLLFAADTASDLSGGPELPWREDGATGLFPEAGLLSARRGRHIFACGLQMGGAVKVWSGEGALVYEDCGYAVMDGASWFVSQGEGEGRIEARPDGGLTLTARTCFRGIPATRFDPWRFVAFRLFTTTFGRAPGISRWLKNLLVKVLIRNKPAHLARLDRRIEIKSDGALCMTDAVTGIGAPPTPLPRHVPFHMGSSRYADFEDWCGAEQPCPDPEPVASGYERRLDLSA